jgi:hypothetical protein
VKGKNGKYDFAIKRTTVLITPYIRMLSSDWLMKGVFFLTILIFFSFSAIARVFA